MTARGFAPLGLLIGLLFLVACAPSVSKEPTPEPAAQPKYGGLLTFYMTADPMGWDLAKTYSNTSRTPISLVTNTLFRYGESTTGCNDYSYHPQLAETWEWLNDTTLRVHLKAGVRFQSKPPVNGRELTAEDVVFTYKHIIQEPNAKTVAEALEDVKAL